jgi:Protein of unknown function (DUF2934)
MKLSKTMEKAVARMAGGAGLKRVAGGVWSTQACAGSGGGRPGWCCGASTVAALEKRELIHAPGQEHLPWQEREWTLVAQDGNEQDSMETECGPGYCHGPAQGARVEAAESASPTRPQDGQQRTREAAYFKALLGGFAGDPVGYWLEAEAEISGRLERSSAG